MIDNNVTEDSNTTSTIEQKHRTVRVLIKDVCPAGKEDFL